MTSSENGGAKSQKVRVVVRVRPLAAAEIDEPMAILEANSFAVAPDGRVSVSVPTSETITRSLDFRFASACGALATQADVYAASARPLVAQFVQGVTGVVLAYGATGSGKTHTLMGQKFSALENHADALSDAAASELAGVVPRVMDDVFHHLLLEAVGATHEVRCSMLEVYREQIFDLLVPDCRVLQHVRENKEGEVSLPAARSELVTGVADVLSLLERGSRQRMVAAHRCNSDSSRGHAILIVSLRRNDGAGCVRESQLYLCDLAGSEKVVKTGVDGVNLKEAAAINTSLLALGNVVQALSTGAAHVPYRSSKLTRLLKAPLTSAAVFIVCVSPSAVFAQETIASLRFGERLQLIKSHATVKTVRSVEFLEHALARAEARILELEAMLMRGGRRDDDDEFVLKRNEQRDDDDDDDDRSGKLRLSLAPLTPVRQPLDNEVATPSRELETPQRTGLEDLVHFVCPLSRRLFRDPVVAADGVTYERSAIEAFLRSNGGAAVTSPVVHRVLGHRHLTPNLLVKAQVQLRFQSLALPDNDNALPFDFACPNLVLEIVIEHLKTIQCVLTFRAVCRRFRTLIEQRYVLMPLAVRLGVLHKWECNSKNAAQLRTTFLKSARQILRHTRSATPLVTSGLHLNAAT